MSDDTQKEEYEESRHIEDLKGKLYGKRFIHKESKLRPTLSSRDVVLSEVWQPDDEDDNFVHRVSDIPDGKIQKIFFLVSTAFFVLAVCVAAFLFFGGSNFISSQNISIAIDAPTSIAGGKEFDVHIKVMNNNRYAVMDANFTITYPDGFIAKDEEGNVITNEYQSVGVLAAGGSFEHVLQGTVFGGEGDVKQIKIVLEYQVENSNAIYTKSQTYDIRIDSAPIGVSISSLTEVNAGQEITFTMTTTSNTDIVMNDVALHMEFPFGFEAKTADPAPVDGTTLWRLGDIHAGGSRTVVVRGIMNGQNNDEKTVRAYVGLENVDHLGELKDVYNESDVSVLVKDVFLGVQLALGGSIADTYALIPGSKISGSITYINNLDVPLRDVRVVLALDGNAISKYGVYTSSGYYDSSAGTITWDTGVYKNFALVEPREKGTLDFSLTLGNPVGNSVVSTKNPSSLLSISIRATREDSMGSAEDRSDAVVRSILLRSDMRLAARAVYSVGPFTNTGNLPPVPEQETTYTILLSAANSSNQLSDVVVTCILPHGVSWKNMIDPSGSSLSYSEFSRTVTWRIGRMSPGAGIDSTGPAVAFQIGLIPSVTDAGDTMPLLSDISVSAYDEFARTRITFSPDKLTTNIISDPVYTITKGSVAR